MTVVCLKCYEPCIIRANIACDSGQRAASRPGHDGPPGETEQTGGDCEQDRPGSHREHQHFDGADQPVSRRG